MPKGIMLVTSRPSDPAREGEYNEWYTNTHIPEVCALPGIVGGRRYRPYGGGDSPAGDPPAYVAIYDLDTDDLGSVMVELGKAFGDGRIHMSDAIQMDPAPDIAVYELME
ncbi:MAG TPA: hypothetical protein VFW63_01575 [Acidimicrobiales bacterium]|nr:hypothetical protein [Acidimicrobiales bacterium]